MDPSEHVSDVALRVVSVEFDRAWETGRTAAGESVEEEGEEGGGTEVGEGGQGFAARYRRRRV